MTIDTRPQPARAMQMETASGSANATSPTQPTRTVAQQPTAEPRPSMTIDPAEASMRGGNLSLGCHCCHGSCSFYKSCC